MLTACRVDDCQFTADGRCENHDSSYSQCLHESACLTPAELEEAAGVLEPLQASQILHDPCAAFPAAETCHWLIEWCCNGATVVVDGQAVFLTLVQEVTAVIEAPVSCELAAASTNGANASDVLQSNIAVKAPTRDLDCSVGLNVSHVHCGTSPTIDGSTSSATTTGVPTTSTQISHGGTFDNETKAWVEVKVDLPFRNTSGVVPEIPGSLLETLGSQLNTSFGEAGMGADNAPRPDFSGATVEVVFDVRTYINYADVRAAVDAAASYYGDSFVHPISTYAPSTTSSQSSTTATAFPVWMLGQTQELVDDFTWTIVGGVIAVVVVAAVVVATILVLRHQAKHRVVRTHSSNGDRRPNSVKVKHAHDGELNHEMKNSSAPKLNARGPRTKAVASVVVPNADDSHASSNENSKKEKPARRVFHRRQTSLSDVSPEFASPDYVADSDNLNSATANRVELTDVDEGDDSQLN